MNNDINQDIAKELVAQTAGKTYDDLAHPTAHATGQIVSFIPRTVKVWLGKWEKWILNGEYAIKETEALLAEKLKHIPEEKIVEPEPYVAVPAIQQLSYSLDSVDLRNLYASLLTSSMNVDKKDAVHPAFVGIIGQLTPDEARLLTVLPEENWMLKPLVDFGFESEERPGIVPYRRNYTDIGDHVCVFPENICAYIENLDRLKIIRIIDDHLVEEKYYSHIFNSDIYLSTKKLLSQQNKTLVCLKKSFYVTDFGRLFINTCVK